MKKLILLVLTVACCYTGYSNSVPHEIVPSPEQTIKVDYKKFFTEYNRLWKVMKCCFFVRDCPQDCDNMDVIFPDKGVPPMKQTAMALKSPKASQLQKDVAAWERGILEGRGGKKIPKNMVQRAFKAASGYGAAAVKARFKMYDQKLGEKKKK